MSDTPSWQEILDLLGRWAESDLESAHLEYGDLTLSVSRSGQAVGAPTAAAPAIAASAPPAAAPAPAPPPTAPVEPSPEPAGSEPGTGVVAPTIGVFFRSPAPGAPPFVRQGDAVEPDTTIGLIEVMKLMNPVVAGVVGVVREFAADDGELVEFGQRIATIGPSR